jgi:hypothetical protein
MTAHLARETHAFYFRVSDVPDLTVDGITTTPASLTVEFLDVEGARTTRVSVTGRDREPDGTLHPHSSHSLPLAEGEWPEWVAFEVAGCVPEGWEG